MTDTNLVERRCLPCEGGVDALDRTTSEVLLGQLKGWSLNEDNTTITRAFKFRNFHDESKLKSLTKDEVMEFVNALAWVAHREDHHPDMLVTYSQVDVTYTTHAIGGLSDNDFICAAKIDALLD